jgi:transcriptional regulator with XRE-family HTH domain
MQGSLAHKLRILRAERELSLREAASLTGVAKETISDIERGLRHPHDPTVAKIAKGYGVPVEALLEEPALPLDKARRGAGPAQTSTQTGEEFERTLAHVLEPVRTEALRHHQALNRLFASEGETQTTIGDIAEAEVGRRFLDAFSPDERPAAFGEVALGYARLERDNGNLEANFTRARKLLRESDEKIAQLEAKIERLEQVEGGNTRLREENARLRQDIAQLRSEAEQESMHR